MAYIGNPPQYANFPVYTNTGNGSTQDYTLTWAPGSPNAILVVVGGVVQRPSTDFTINGTTLHFNTAVINGVAFTVYALGMNATTNVPVDASVSAAKIAPGAIEAATTTPFSHRNKIINGNMRIAQRATSATFSSPSPGSYHTLDRWGWSGDGTYSITMSQQTFNPGEEVAHGIWNFMRFVINSASGQTWMGVEQKIENVRTLNGKTVTLSFWAKAATACVVGNQLQQVFGTGGSARVNVPHATFNLTTSWQKFTYTAELPSILGKTLGSNSFLNVYFSFPNNTTNTIDITGVQLEEGSVATPFEDRSVSVELALCQRYYQVSKFMMRQWFGSVTTNYFSEQRVVTMRTTPTESIVGSPITSVNVSSVTLGEVNDAAARQIVVHATAIGITTYVAVWEASAEL